jgi:formylmethanofuran dehydrogenase subunit D
MLVDPNTYSTGTPTFKGVPVEVEVAMNERVPGAIELVRKACGLGA